MCMRRALKWELLDKCKGQQEVFAACLKCKINGLSCIFFLIYLVTFFLLPSLLPSSFPFAQDWCWTWNSNTLATSREELTHWKWLWCWEGRGAGGEGDDRGWDGWMASPTRWAWVWVNSGSWWWTGRPGCCGSWGHKELDTTERLNWTELSIHVPFS